MHIAGSLMIPTQILKSEDGFGPVTEPHIGSPARSSYRDLRAPTNYILQKAVEGWGPTGVALFRMIAAELLDWREGRLRHTDIDIDPAGSPLSDSDRSYKESLEYLLGENRLDRTHVSGYT